MNVRERLLIAVLSVILVAAPAGPASARQSASTPSPAIDPAALVLTPADTEEAGYYHDGAFFESLDDMAVNLATYRGGAPGDIQDALQNAGWMRKYVSILRQPTSPNATTFQQSVMCYITEFQDEAGAAKGFDITENEEGVASARDIPTLSTIGTRSEITVDQGTSGVSGQHYVSFDLTFQLDRFTAGVTLYQYDAGSQSATPQATPAGDSTAAVERLAGIVAQRLADNAGGPGFTNAAQRLAGDDADYITYDDAYYRLDRQDVPLLNESASAATARTASYGNASDVYQLWQGVNAATSDGLLYAAALFRFPTAPDASAWLRDAPRTLATNPAYPRLAKEAASPAIGDESMALTYSPKGADSRVKATIVIARIGADVLRIQLAPVGNHQVATRAMVEEIATAQANCLRNGSGSCAPIPLPSN